MLYSTLRKVWKKQKQELLFIREDLDSMNLRDFLSLINLQIAQILNCVGNIYRSINKTVFNWIMIKEWQSKGLSYILSIQGFSVTVNGSDHKGQSCLAHVGIGNVWYHHQETFFIIWSSQFSHTSCSNQPCLLKPQYVWYTCTWPGNPV
jgi:hypothetical protein